jgi:azurin
MKNKFSLALPIVALGCGALLFSITGCSRAPEGPPKTVAVNADDHMKFDLTAFEVQPGQKVIVNFKNVGTTPKFSMGHNFVLLDRSVNTSNVQTFLDKASMEAAHDYIPPGAKEVLAASKLLGPGETDTVTFTAPFVPGEYRRRAK